MDRSKMCVVTSLDPSMGFFSNFMQAIDNVLSCKRRGMESIVWWQPKTFNYGGATASQEENVWTRFFEPVGNITERDIQTARHTNSTPDWNPRDPNLLLLFRPRPQPCHPALSTVRPLEKTM